MYTINEISRAFNQTILLNQRGVTGNQDLTEAEALDMPLPASMTGAQAWGVIKAGLDNPDQWMQAPSVEEVTGVSDPA